MTPKKWLMALGSSAFLRYNIRLDFLREKSAGAKMLSTVFSLLSDAFWLFLGYQVLTKALLSIFKFNALPQFHFYQ
ncbi:hypothetical protein [Alkanindiges hydrocarboniclasticus]|uniref:hypothetical protein n=1 Tax=Alkanindiges hydrocarboniclasticus TaxID=1907941 RepID=UPI001177B84A|nr:hypothetical protein [Alkanindiges hydrocarboniclasticus]